MRNFEGFLPFYFILYNIHGLVSFIKKQVIKSNNYLKITPPMDYIYWLKILETVEVPKVFQANEWENVILEFRVLL